MYLFLLTIVYCAITYIVKLPYDLAFGIILVVLGALKGYFSQEFNDFLNLASARELYKKNGLLDSLFEFLLMLF